MDVLTVLLAVLLGVKLGTWLFGRVVAVKLVDRLYLWFRKHGDTIHMAYGVFTAKVLEYGIKSNSVHAAISTACAAFLLALAYLMYQLFQRDEYTPKDIAVYVASFSMSLAYILGIPFELFE